MTTGAGARAGADRCRRADTAHRDGGRAVGGGAVTELAARVLAPALDLLVGEPSATEAAAGTDRSGGRDGLDRSGRGLVVDAALVLAAVARRSVAQRAHVAAAPALDGVVGEDGAADVVTGAHCDRRLDPADRHGLPAVRRLAVTELTEVIVAPAGDFAAREQGAAVAVAGADRLGRDAADAEREHAVALTTSDVAGVVATPALDRAAGEQSTGMVGAGTDRDSVHYPAHRDRDRANARNFEAAAELAVCVVAPALDQSARDDSAAVEPPDREGLGVLEPVGYDWSEAARGRAVTELAVGVAPPAPDPAARDDGATVRIRGADRGGRCLERLDDVEQESGAGGAGAEHEAVVTERDLPLPVDLGDDHAAAALEASAVADAP